jgi:hypothetical protein
MYTPGADVPRNGFQRDQQAEMLMTGKEVDLASQL